MAQLTSESRGLGETLLEKAGEAMRRDDKKNGIFMWIGASEAYVRKEDSGLVAEVELLPAIYDSLHSDGRLPEMQSRLEEVAAGIARTISATHDPGKRLEEQLRSLILYACDDRTPHQGILPVGQ